MNKKIKYIDTRIFCSFENHSGVSTDRRTSVGFKATINFVGNKETNVTLQTSKFLSSIVTVKIN